MYGKSLAVSIPCGLRQKFAAAGYVATECISYAGYSLLQDDPPAPACRGAHSALCKELSTNNRYKFAAIFVVFPGFFLNKL